MIFRTLFVQHFYKDKNVEILFLSIYRIKEKKKGEIKEVNLGACFVIGLIWVGSMWYLMRRLDELPIEEYDLKPFVPTPVSWTTTSSQMKIIEGGVNVSSIYV